MCFFMDGMILFLLFELWLGYEEFGVEIYVYFVVWVDYEIDEVLGYVDKIIFNSLGQFDRYFDKVVVCGIKMGLCLNLCFFIFGFDLVDLVWLFLCFGEWDLFKLEQVLDCISGVMIYYNCENGDFDLFDV